MWIYYEMAIHIADDDKLCELSNPFAVQSSVEFEASKMLITESEDKLKSYYGISFEKLFEKRSQYLSTTSGQLELHDWQLCLSALRSLVLNKSAQEKNVISQKLDYLEKFITGEHRDEDITHTDFNKSIGEKIVLLKENEDGQALFISTAKFRVKQGIPKTGDMTAYIDQEGNPTTTTYVLAKITTAPIIGMYHFGFLNDIHSVDNYVNDLLMQ